MATDRDLARAELERRGVDPFSGLSDNPLIEILLQGATGAGASIAGGLAGLAGLPYGIDAAANAVRRTQDALTYQPRSRQAQEFGQSVGELMAPIEQGKQWLGDKAFEATGSPLAATLAYTAPEIIESALGLRAAKGLGGQQYEIGDIGGQTTGMGRRERGAVGGPEDYKYHRFYSGKGPMSRAGYAMFSDDMERVEHYGDRHYATNAENAVDADDLREEFIDVMSKEDDLLADLGASAEDLADELNPDDVVDSAEIWDNEDIVEIVWEKILFPKGIDAVRLNDGVIVFNEDLISDLGDKVMY